MKGFCSLELQNSLRELHEPKKYYQMMNLNILQTRGRGNQIAGKSQLKLQIGHFPWGQSSMLQHLAKVSGVSARQILKNKQKREPFEAWQPCSADTMAPFKIHRFRNRSKPFVNTESAGVTFHRPASLLPGSLGGSQNSLINSVSMTMN